MGKWTDRSFWGATMQNAWLAVIGILAAAAVMDLKLPSYPPTKRENVVETLHGVPVEDPYRWLENGEAPEVQQWTEQQNTFSRSVLDGLPGRSGVHKRLNELL